jgi:hypothetical protein
MFLIFPWGWRAPGLLTPAPQASGITIPLDLPRIEEAEAINAVAHRTRRIITGGPTICSAV